MLSTNYKNEIAQFRRTVWAHYKKSGRHDLPWRKTNDLYRTLVSEVMLQQTQVERVIPFYKKFIRTFPTAKKLGAAPLGDVLRNWQGLGYNRRAKMLQQAAKEMAVRKYTTITELETLPGVGPYTARALAAFVFNTDSIVIETNIRTAVIEHFFPSEKKIEDEEIGEILERALPKGKAREWYSALMDYGAHLKRSGISHNVRSTGNVKQSKFAGSLREARGAILRELTKGMFSRSHLVHLLGEGRQSQSATALDALHTEGLVQMKRTRYALAE